MKDKSNSNKTENKKPVAKVRKKNQRTVPVGIAYVLATFNNTLITVTDLAGHTIASSSGGQVGFKGARKGSAFAATLAAQEAAKEAITDFGLKEIEINLKGPGAGRESAVRGFQSTGLNVTVIRDITPINHNGCKSRKRRRV